MGISEINDVNAEIMAKRRNIEVRDIRSSKTHGFTNLITVRPVSYTHLDVYKRQEGPP